MIIISSKIRLDAMSKVISFSISDKYLEKLRTLYPSLTDNLAAKQFITDGLDSSLGNSLDGNLDGDLDGKLKSLIETSLDGLLDERLDATVGKLITSLSERMARLEERLDTNLDGGLDESIARLGSCFSHRLLGLEKRLDEMELLLRMQREASIATSPIVEPTGEPSPLPPSPPDRPAIETVTPEVSPSPPDAIASIDGTVETVEPNSSIETVAIETVGMTAMAAVDYLETKKVKVSYDSLNRWINKEKTIPDTRLGKKVQKYLTLINQLYYPNP